MKPVEPLGAVSLQKGQRLPTRPSRGSGLLAAPGGFMPQCPGQLCQVVVRLGGLDGRAGRWAKGAGYSGTGGVNEARSPPDWQCHRWR